MRQVKKNFNSSSSLIERKMKKRTLYYVKPGECIVFFLSHLRSDDAFHH